MGLYLVWLMYGFDCTDPDAQMPMHNFNGVDRQRPHLALKPYKRTRMKKSGDG